MIRKIIPIFIALSALACAGDDKPVDQPAPPGAQYEGDAFTFSQVRPGIYHIRGTGALAVGCNTTLIVNDQDAMLVDSHISPAAIWALMNEMKRVTDKPIRYVVNTHFHFDHAHGNQMFPEGVEIIGHTFTRDKITSGGSKSGRSYESFIGTLPDRIAQIEQQIAAAADDSTRDALQRQLSYQKNYREATDAVIPTAPKTTLNEKLEFQFGERRVQILFLGRGHTGGDVVVFLPGEKALITGDLMTAGLAYLGDGYPEEWVATLERVKALDFDVVLPGHGEPFEDKARFDHFAAYLKDFWAQAVAMRKDGVPAEEAAKRIDLTAHAEYFPQLTAPGAPLAGVLRAYELIDGAAD